MEIERALSDIEEVRDRLAHVQRFEGYSGPAAAASGAVAVAAGFVQQALVPLPVTPDALRTYVLIWIACLAVALALNYGAVAAWVIKHRSPGARSQFRTAARSIAPSIILGGALSLALGEYGAYALLPGTWFALYAIGLFASRSVVPSSAIGIMLAFAALAITFLVTPLAALALAWWVMPLGFGIGQIGIGYLIWKDGRHA
jgi:hypothetical protein